MVWSDYYKHFTDEMLTTIINNALHDGYEVQKTIWKNADERDSGSPSFNKILTKEELFNTDNWNLPTVNEFDKDGCAEWNFVKDDDYICFYHIEHNMTYIHKESMENFYM